MNKLSTTRVLVTLGGLLLTSAAFAVALGTIVPIQEVFEPSGSFPTERYAKIAVVQWASNPMSPVLVDAPTAEAVKAKNRRDLEVWVRQAAGKGAKWVITPEMSITGYPDIPELPAEEDDWRSRDDIAGYVESVPGPTTEHFSKLAAELGIYLHIGLATVDSVTNHYHNTVVVLNPKGEIVTTYHKQNLYSGEDKFLAPGTENAVYDSPIGRIGLIICADVYADGPLKRYRDSQTDILALSTSWAHMNTGMDQFKSAAREYKMWLFAANQPYFPDSGVIEPSGETQSHIRQTRIGIAYGYVPFKDKR